MIYTDENEILRRYQSGFPKQFDNYKKKLENENFDNTCNTTIETFEDGTKCGDIADGILYKGIRSAQIFLSENIRKTIT